MIRINLLPYREERKKAGLQRQAMIMILAIGAFMVLIGALHVFMSLKVSSMKDQISQAQKRFALLQKVTGDLEKFKKDKELVQKKLSVITSLEAGRMFPVMMLRDVAKKMPAGQVWLSAIDDNGSELRLEGVAADNKAVALFMTELGQSPYVSTVDLVSTKQVEIEGLKLMNFMLICRMKRV